MLVGLIINVIVLPVNCYLGIGSIPDSVLSKLKHHRDLGIHSEMFSDGIVTLTELGVITNARKVIQTGKIVGGFAFGTKRLYDFMNNNPFVGQLIIVYTVCCNYNTSLGFSASFGLF